MFKNLRISIGLLCVLGVFAAVQILSCSMGLWFLKDNNSSISALKYNSDEQKALNNCRNAVFNARVILDSTVMQLQLDPTQVNLVTTIESMKKQLDYADQQFNTFWIIPGLSTTQPELGEAVKKAWQAQKKVLQSGINILTENVDSHSIIKHINDMQEERLTARQDWDNEYNVYIDATQKSVEQAVQTSNHGYQFSVTVMSALIMVIIGLSLLVHFWLRKILVRPLQRVAQYFAAIGKGDLSQTILIENRNEIGLLSEALHDMQNNLVETVSTIRQGVESINLGTQEIAAGNADLSSRTEEQSAALVETAASMEQISATVKLNADNAQQASEMIHSASAIVGEGEEQMQNMMGKMHAIRSSAQKMLDIISVIDGIAFQTNILALNAAVEAARAGEAGRGFAVVAGEVRNLAQRCANSAKEIGGLITSSTRDIQEGAELADKTSDTMTDIIVAIRKINSMMESISHASDEQNRGVEQIRIAITQMDQVTQQNAALVEEVATTAANVEEQASSLAQSVAVFRLYAPSDDKPEQSLSSQYAGAW